MNAAVNARGSHRCITWCVTVLLPLQTSGALACVPIGHDDGAPFALLQAAAPYQQQAACVS